LQRIPKLAAEKLGIAEEHFEPYGHYNAKVSLDYVDSLTTKSDRCAPGRLPRGPAETDGTPVEISEHTAKFHVGTFWQSWVRRAAPRR
jgi:hypothetical protein